MCVFEREDYHLVRESEEPVKQKSVCECKRKGGKVNKGCCFVYEKTAQVKGCETL